MANGTQAVRSSSSDSNIHLEYYLVIWMLVALLVLVIAVMVVPVGLLTGGIKNLAAKDILGFRSNILTTVLTAFGAWIGAGAAYFFGTKNLKQATDAIEKAQSTGRDRLAKLKISSMSPEKVAWSAAPDWKLSEVIKRLNAEPCDWWFPLVDDKGRFDTVVHEECVFRFVEHKLETEPGVSYQDMASKTAVSDFAAWIRKQSDLKTILWGIHVEASLEDTAQAVNDAMVAKKVHMAIILDAERKPAFSISEGSIKKALEEL